MCFKCEDGECDYYIKMPKEYYENNINEGIEIEIKKLTGGLRRVIKITSDSYLFYYK